MSLSIAAYYSQKYAEALKELKAVTEERDRYRAAADKAAKTLDAIKFDLSASVYTLEDDEFETVFYVRDLLQEVLRK